MGAACAKDRAITSKHGGDGGANAVGRQLQRAAQANVAEDKAGPQGATGKKKNGSAGKPAGGGGGGIAAYNPNSDVAEAYFDRINELRNVAVSIGVMRAVEGSGEANSTANSDGISLAESRKTSDYPAAACPPLTTLTVYQCQPLAGDAVVAKGMYSSVYLARLSVFTGTTEVALSARVPRHPATRRTNDGSSFVFADPACMEEPNSSLSFPSFSVGGNGGSAVLPSGSNAGGGASHYIIAMKEMLVYPSYSSGLMLEHVSTEVRNWTRLSASNSRLLRCYALEYVYSEGVSAAVKEACCHFYPGLPSSEVRSPKASTTSPRSSPIGRMLERIRSPSGGSSPKLFGSFGKARGSLSQDATLAEAGGTPQKLRLYLEYAKYGTLRGYQSKDIPEKFGRRRLHELTARAYMRDVLLALLQVHECGELQYDLCAKSIFLSRPIHVVYGTYFPAYISDVPAGDLTRVTPTQLDSALRLLDPPVPPLSSSINGNNVGDQRAMHSRKTYRGLHTTGNEPINDAVQQNGSAVFCDPAGPPNVQLASALDSGAYNAQGDISVMTYDASMRLQTSFSEPKSNHNVSSNVLPITAYEQSGAVHGVGAARHTGRPSPEEAVPLADLATPLRVEHSTDNQRVHNSGMRPTGKQARTNSPCTAGCVEGDVAADHQRLNEVYCRYMSHFDFKGAGDDGVPFPSPHDGIEAQADADMIATTMLPDEPRTTPAMQVVALQRSNLGGVAIVSPNHFVVKPGSAFYAPDLRGRLLMVLSPSTNKSALVCGNPHTTAPTFSPTAVSRSSPPTLAMLPPTHTMSSGTTMTDAAGALGRARGGLPLTKLNHSSLIRRALAYGDADKVEDIHIYKYVTVTHAAPEVLHRHSFSQASDIYAFAMTFIELVTDNGAIMEECRPQNLPKPKTRREKEDYDAQLTTNLDKWYQTRISALRQNFDAVAKEQELPAALSPRAAPTVVRIPEHLSDEARGMLRWCLQADPRKRPTAVELLCSRYFMLGDWIASPTAVAAERGVMKPPEKPWDTTVSFDAAARAIGLPLLQE
ncbi:hypothetical protein ABL78_6430 [Leptomonas seymouri]|uniref:Protein kinase domain-containing protein n=1 Tax=Leptomonas seymouri TaxID=5684 RepID=A0A0N1PCY0_LEPSE|nr:hypothetical protein ABL78_6430 [Leptomonas seymouri]|eukprot:KPI84520.1 hypothetical protein ABL78_6430 [Leptomonas seymouri]